MQGYAAIDAKNEGCTEDWKWRGWGHDWEKCVNINFTFFELCLLWYIYVKKTNKMHTFLYNLFHLNYPGHVLKVIVHHQEELCTSSLKHFTVHLERSLVTHTIRYHLYRVSDQTPLRCMMKYCKLLVQKSSWWWWTTTCPKHVQDNLSEINYKEKYASCWSFSLMSQCN